MKLSVSQLSRCLNVNNGIVSMACSRNHLISEGNGKNRRIDISLPTNVMWLDKQKLAGYVLDLNQIQEPEPSLVKEPKKKTPVKTKKPSKSNITKPEKKSTLEEIRATELKKKMLEVERLKKQNILDDLKIQKLKGELIPTDAVKKLFLYATQTSLTTFLQEAKSLALVYIQILGGDHTTHNELTKEIEEKIYLINADYKENITQGIKGVVSEYQEVRGRGERK